jgi:hypothetical protein
MLEAVQGDDKPREEIIEAQIEYTGIFMAVTFMLGFTIMRHNDCRGFYMKRDWTKPKAHVVTVCGFESDVRRVQMLDASLQIQCASAMASWWKKEDRSWYTKMQAFKDKREFIENFIYGVAEKLHAANEAGKKEAVKNQAARTNTSEAQATESVALVLRTRKEQVNDWMDKKHGSLRSGRSRSYQSGSGSAAAAGRAAGRSANVSSGGRVGGGSRGSLGR